MTSREEEIDAAVRAWMYAPLERRVGAAHEMLECTINPLGCPTCRLWRLNIVEHWERRQALSQAARILRSSQKKGKRVEDTTARLKEELRISIGSTTTGKFDGPLEETDRSYSIVKK